MLDVKSKVSEAEWQLRVDLAACYRLVALHGWDDLIIAGAQMMAKQVTRSAGGGLAWPALLRKLDRLDRSYRD